MEAAGAAEKEAGLGLVSLKDVACSKVEGGGGKKGV